MAKTTLHLRHPLTQMLKSEHSSYQKYQHTKMAPHKRHLTTYIVIKSPYKALNKPRSHFLRNKKETIFPL